MQNEISIATFNVTHKAEYDLLLATVGYETRSRFISETYPAPAKMKWAFGFRSNQLLEYSSNREWFSLNGYTISDVDEESFDEHFCDLLRLAVEHGNGCVRIRIDISSMTRSRLAIVISELSQFSSELAVTVDFVYSLAEYSPPPRTVGKNIHVGPVIPEFSGWWTEPDRPLTAIVGLGYEENKALGALEHIQATDIWVFVPRSAIAQYTQALTAANADLLRATPPSRILTYDVGDPMTSLAQLESLSAGVIARKNLILLPFGPKIFVLVSLLTARIHHPEIAVWRVSGSEEVVDRKPSKYVMGLRVVFSPPDLSDL